MPTNATLSVTPSLEVEISGPDGCQRIKLSRIAAQSFCAALRNFSGTPTKGIELNAGVFRTVVGESRSNGAKAARTVRLKDSPGRRGHVVRL